MGEDIQRFIKELNNKLDEYSNRIKKIEKQVEILKEKEETDHAIILKQEQELKELENKLVECNQQKEQIKTNLDKKIEEAKENKDQIIKLLTEYGINGVCQKLVKVWTDYAQTQDNFIKVLKKKNQKEQGAVKRLEQTKQNQFIIIVFLLIITSLLSLSPLLLQK